MVSNVDEPGRIPYAALTNFSGGDDCTNGCVTSTGKVVPAGKRLVIMSLTGEINLSVPAGVESSLSINNCFDGGYKIPVISAGQSGNHYLSLPNRC